MDADSDPDPEMDLDLDPDVDTDVDNNVDADVYVYVEAAVDLSFFNLPFPCIFGTTWGVRYFLPPLRIIINVFVRCGCLY